MEFNFQCETGLYPFRAESISFCAKALKYDEYMKMNIEETIFALECFSYSQFQYLAT